LLWMAQQHMLDRGIVGARGSANGFAYIFALRQGNGVLEANDMRAVRLAPGGNRYHRRTTGHGQERDAFERAGGMPEKVHGDGILGVRVLIENKDHDCALGEKLKNTIHRAALRNGSETGLLKTAGDEVVEPRRIQRASHEVK